MEQLEEKLGAILNNPDMMRQIMSMAQAMKSPAPEPEPKSAVDHRNQSGEAQSTGPILDPAMLQKFAGMAQQTSIDRDQQALLRALGPYLSRQRLRKLENAMRAAKMARIASSAMGIRGGKIPTGR